MNSLLAIPGMMQGILGGTTATNRLKKMCLEGLLVELSTGPFDPYKTFILAEPRNKPRKT
ncbi:MAG: hypothetical protein FJZ61_06080 [Chlamydiae bacterium]|nr:hypothetical protein [Chlamydiota bacterium]